jgi:hypothetical protein
MRKILSGLVSLFFWISLIAPLSLSAATTTGVAKLEITAPTSAKVGEAIDITVRAVDGQKNTISAYRGSVIFNTDTIGDTVPMPGRSYTFTADDAGQKTFSKGLIFKKTGKQKVYVTDVSEDIAGEATITVEAGGSVSTTNDQNIIIITPENGTKVTTDMVMVSGKTRKNSKVSIKLNGKDQGTVVTDDGGIFTKSVNNVTQEENILTAELIDANNSVIAKSSETKFSKTVTSSSTYGVTINPASTVEVSSPIEVIVDATAGLPELTIGIDGTILPTKETSVWKYSLKTVAPNREWTYKITITQKDALGQAKTTDSPTSLTVTPKIESPITITPPLISSFRNVKTVTQTGQVIFDFSVENPPAELRSFKIAYGTDANSLTKEVNTYTLDRIRSRDTAWGYSWYVDNLTPGTYTFKIFGRTEEGTTISWLVSEPIVATIGQPGCTIGNVGNLQVQTDTSKSTITWTALTWAISYNVYKVSPSGDYVLVQNVKDPSYTLFLSKWAVTYDNFAIKGLCDEKTESKDYSKVTKVQSGPGLLAFVVIASALVWAFIMRRKSF